VRAVVQEIGVLGKHHPERVVTEVKLLYLESYLPGWG